MQYGWMRQWARDTLKETGNPVPELSEVMESAQTGDNAIDRIINSVKKVIPKAVSTAQAALAQLSYSGTTGNFQSAEETITLVGKFLPLVDTYPEKIGSPLYKPKVINSLSGFLLCKDAVFESTIATETEKTAVEAFLNSGMYFE